MANIGHGATLTGTTAGAIGEITNISISGISVDEIDVSDMASTDKWREFIPGLINAGEISVSINFDGTVASTIITKVGVSDTWTILFSDSGAGTFACSGFIKDVSFDNPVDDKVTGEVVIKLTGKPTFTA